MYGLGPIIMTTTFIPVGAWLLTPMWNAGNTDLRKFLDTSVFYLRPR